MLVCEGKQATPISKYPGHPGWSHRGSQERRPDLPREPSLLLRRASIAGGWSQARTELRHSLAHTDRPLNRVAATRRNAHTRGGLDRPPLGYSRSCDPFHDHAPAALLCVTEGPGRGWDSALCGLWLWGRSQVHCPHPPRVSPQHPPLPGLRWLSFPCGSPLPAFSFLVPLSSECKPWAPSLASPSSAPQGLSPAQGGQVSPGGRCQEGL